jgi:hypothetical protein
MAFDLSSIGLGDIGLGLEGIGTLASAWGQYQLGKEQNKLIKGQLDYQKQKDALALKKLQEREDAINQAFGVTAPSDETKLIPSLAV